MIRSRSRSLCTATLLGAALFVHGTTRADAPLEGTKPAHWRVVWTEDPATTATVLWSTAERGKDRHAVDFRRRGSEEVEGTKIATSGPYTGASKPLYHHRVQLTDLEPGTSYEFRLKSGSEASRWLWFTTAPGEDRPFSILHGGDSRSDSATRRKVNRMMAELVEKSFENDDPADDVIAFAHGGDFIASGPNVEQWSQWMTDHELTTTADGRVLPIVPTRGNHDRGAPFDEVFGFPDDDDNVFGTSLGPEVRLVTLNSEISTAGEQRTWLEAELKQSRPKVRWLLAQYHRPAFPAVKGPGAALQSWVPLFERYDVDLVCESDGHVIKRTVPIRDGKRDETGVVYVGEGGLGVKQRTPKTDRWYLESPGMAESGHHVFYITFEPKQLTCRCVRLDGAKSDEFTRNVRRR